MPFSVDTIGAERWCDIFLVGRELIVCDTCVQPHQRFRIYALRNGNVIGFATTHEKSHLLCPCKSNFLRGVYGGGWISTKLGWNSACAFWACTADKFLFANTFSLQFFLHKTNPVDMSFFSRTLSAKCKTKKKEFERETNAKNASNENCILKIDFHVWSEASERANIVTLWLDGRNKSCRILCECVLCGLPDRAANQQP